MSDITVHPAGGVHLARVGDDLVVLDLNADAYACMPELGARLTRREGCALEGLTRVEAEELAATGLFSHTPSGEPRRPLPGTPCRTSRGRPAGRGTVREAAQFAGAVLHARRTFPGRPLKALVAPPMPRPRSATPEDTLVRRAVLFDRWLPWAPGQGVCLYRAFTLRSFLGAAGLSADWVFGVRAWPFGAHCWLQAGDVLLDDDLDRVGLYTPILAA